MQVSTLDCYGAVNKKSDGAEMFICYHLFSHGLPRTVLSIPRVGRVAQSVQLLATGWTVRGSNLDRGEILRTCPDRPWGPPSLLYNGYRVFPGGKERPPSAVGHERVELYLYSPYGPYGLYRASVPVQVWNLPYLCNNSQYTGSLFYMTNIVLHFLSLPRFDCELSDERSTSIRSARQEEMEKKNL